MSVPLIEYSEDYLLPAHGFTNTGSICWLNSITQALLSCTALTQVLLENEDDFAYNDFAKVYIDIIKASNSNSVVAKSAALVAKLRDAVEVLRGAKTTFTTSQECAEEGFTYIIDAFHSQRVTNLFATRYQVSIVCESCKRTITTTDRAYRIAMFGIKFTDTKQFNDYLCCHSGELESFKCQCGHENKNVTRQERLTLAREIIVCMFNKYHSKSLITYPDELRFPSKVAPGEPPKSLVYKLVSNVEHSGNASGGHYWANSTRASDEPGPASKVYRTNDTIVSPGDLIPRENTFIIMYHFAGYE